MSKQNQSTPETPWWGDGVSYSISDTPSEYVASVGKDFLKENYQGGLVVDFGVWNGRNLKELTEIGGDIVGTETLDSAQMLRQTTARFPSMRFELMPLTKLTFDDASIGAALCWRVLHNLVRPGDFAGALRELSRVLKLKAPLLVAVRFDGFRKVTDDDEACYIRRLPNGSAGVRETTYFTPEVFKKLVALFGFSGNTIGRVLEDEMVNEELIVNEYLVAHLVKIGELKAHSASQAEKYFKRAD